MDTFVENIASNAVMATLIALVVAIATRLIRRPEVAYWLWMLVLVKLVTPPIIDLPLPVEGPAKLALFDAHEVAADKAEPLESSAVAETVAEEAPANEGVADETGAIEAPTFPRRFAGVVLGPDGSPVSGAKV
jgi:hypothetical protein